MERESIREATRAIAGYDFGQSATALFELDRLINQSHGDVRVRSWIEAELVELLRDEVSLAAQQEVCRRLWRIGTDDSLAALETMLAQEDPRVVAAACYAIGRRPSERADDVLRTALKKSPEACRAPIEQLIEDRR